MVFTHSSRSVDSVSLCAANKPNKTVNKHVDVSCMLLSINKSISQSINQSINQTNNQSNKQTINQSINQFIAHAYTFAHILADDVVIVTG